MRFRNLALISAASAFALWTSACSDDKSSAPEEDAPLVSSAVEESSSSVADKNDTESSSSDSTTPSSSSIAAPTNGLLLDDMEDGDGGTSIGSGWYTYNDNDNKAASVITTPVDESGNPIASPTDNGSSYAFKVEFTLDKGDYAYDPYVGWGFEVPSTVDVSKYAGIRYSYKGAAHYIHVETSDVIDYDVHLSAVKKSDTWTTVTIDFNNLVQGGWGEAVAFDPAHVTNISFQVKGNGKVDSVMIDDVYFIMEEDLPPKTADMTIHAPQVISPNIGDITISTPLQEKAMKYLDKGVNFTNWLEEADGKFTGKFELGENDVKILSENGFKALRLPIDLDLYVDNRAEYLADTTGTVKLQMNDSIYIVLDSFVNWTKRYGMSLTIDYHEYDNSYNVTTSTDAKYLAMMANVWKAVAAHYASNEREDLFFELLNEPDMKDGKVTQANWTIAAQGMIDSIRTVDTKHTIIFGDAQWYSIALLAKRTPFTDDNIIYAVHSYEPYIFTHQGASWTEASSIKNLPFPYDTTKWSVYSSDFGVNASTASWIKSAVKNYYKTGSKGYILNQIYTAKKWAVENQVPIIINEFGAYNVASTAEDRLNYLTAVRESCDSLQVPWQHWGYTGGFEVIRAGKLIDGMDKALGL